MRLILLIFAFSAINGIANGFFANFRRQSKSFQSSEDAGDPLFLTKYIEEGDIETVSKIIINYS